MEHANLVELLNAVVPVVATFLLGLLSKYVYNKIQSDYWKGVLQRATDEIYDAVAEVGQTYVDEIRLASEDGLTDEEKAEAKSRAMATAKSNLGPKGLARLLKMFNGDSAALDTWLSTKVESTVRHDYGRVRLKKQ